MSNAMRRLSEALVNVLRKGTDDSFGTPKPTPLGAPSSPKSGDTSTSASGSIIEGDATVVVDDTIYEDYDPQKIRDLRRSWPQTAQEANFRYGTQVKSSRNADLGLLGDKVKVLEQTVSPDGSFIETHSQSSADPAHVRQIINWDQLPEESVAILDRSTVWNGGSALYDIDVDEAEITRIVSKFQPPKVAKRSASMKSTRESILDQKRATTISVAMKRMRLQPSKFGKLAWALRDMNEAYLTPTAVEIMVKASLWATPKEFEDMKAKVREGHELADPDALLWFLATSVPDTSARINALAFRYEFDEVIGEMIRATSLIKAASLEICTSELLKRLMRVILLLGNNINETYGGTAAWGISLASLSKLSTVKTTDKSMSVLDCVILYLDQFAPETFGVADDCTCTPSAAKYSISTETNMLKEARRGLDSVRKIKAMEKFYLSAAKKLDEMERELRLAQDAFDKCLDHFCIPRGTIETNLFFGTLASFFDDVDKAVASHEAKQRQSMNPGIRSGLLNPAFMKMRRESSMSFGSASGATPRKLTSYEPRPSATRPSIFGRMKPGN